MANIQRLIKREVASKETIRVVTVIGQLRMINLSAPSGGPTAAPVWVTDVEFGSGKPMKSVPIKNINGSLAYAQRGRTVQIRRTALGRWQIVAPGDRINSTNRKIRYSLSTKAQTGSDVNTGFSFKVEPFESFQGPQSMRGNPSITFAVTTITRATGSFITDGLVNGLAIIQGTTSNNSIGTETITTVAATVLTFSGSSFTVETVASGARIANSGTSVWGTQAFNLTQLIDANGAVV